MLSRLAGIAAVFAGLVALASGASKAQMAPPEPYQVVHGWPDVPMDSVLGQVSGVAVDSQDHVFAFTRAENSWVADPDDPMTIKLSPSPASLSLIASATVLTFDGRSGALLAEWGRNQFLIPHGLRVDGNDHVWVTDIVLHQVFEFSHDGRLLRSLGTARTPGVDATHFNKPADVAFGPDGAIYVADGYGNNRIAKFSAEGRFLLDWGHQGSGPGEFNLPHNVVVDRAGRVYVADRGNARIQVFDGDGRLLDIWQSSDLGRPWGLAIGPDNLLYVVDGGEMTPPFPPPKGRGRILKLDLSGRILARWARFGNYDGQIFWGHDLAVGKDGAVYVGDVFHGMRLQKFIPSP